MKRTELQEKILWIISKSETGFKAADRLTGLFIELSNERCEKQRNICEREYISESGMAYNQFLGSSILNAPLPEIN